MIVYIIAGVAVLLFLVLAYRTLGGASVGALDSPRALRSAAEDLSDAAGKLGAAHGSSLTLTRASGGGDAVRTARGDVESAGQLLEQMDAGALSGTELDARALLRSAVIELRWAARLLETHPTADTEGVQRAVSALLEHATRCTDSARSLLRESGQGAEVRDGATEPFVE